MSKLSQITDRLLAIESSLPEPRTSLSLAEKIELIQRTGGPTTVRSILKATRDFPLARIPWLFSSIDSQYVVDVLNNDMEEALEKYSSTQPGKTG